jgi:hypothetical protein
MEAPEIEAFLTHLVVGRKVSVSTQNQARSALLFLYKEIFYRITMAGAGGTSQGFKTTAGGADTAGSARLAHELSGTMGLIASLL